MEPNQLTATEAVDLIRQRKLSCEELMRSCLARITQRDHIVKAWLHVDAELAIRAARARDNAEARGVLQGLPFGVKDVIDTAEMPTTQNSAIYQGFQVRRDAACVAVMKGAGGVVLGKTDTDEFASRGRRALTRNPRNTGHTPGGSSSGSAAAVADFMVPLALGTQSGGSLIRPAAFNGIYGFKPSWNLVSREGVRMVAQTLDTVGWFARCMQDLALVGEAFRLRRYDAPVALRALRVGVCRTPAWRHIEPSGAAALEAAAHRLGMQGASLHELTLPPEFDGLMEAQATIMYREGGTSFLPEYVNAYPLLGEAFRDKVENTKGISDQKLLDSYALADRCRVLFDRLFGQDLDVVLAPAAPGEAPEGLESTGSSIFNGMWTLLHVPCIGVPSATGNGGLPTGVQLIGPRMSDARLLGIAAALAPVIDPNAAPASWR